MDADRDEGSLAAARADDVLVMDGDAGVREGLAGVLREAGFSVTAIADPERARDQIANRFFAAVLVDLDTPERLGGLELLQFIRKSSPLTAVIVLTPRRSFEAVANAFRAGATDVIPKTQEALPYLRERVVAAARDIRARVERDKLLEEMGDLHERFLLEMMALSRQVIDLEDRLLRTADEGSTASGPIIAELLVVDDEHHLAGELSRRLGAEQGWHVRTAQTGGEALDVASQMAPHVLLTRETLPDFPATMLVKTIKANAPDLVALVMRPPTGDQTGEVRMIENSRVMTLLPAFTDPEQLVASLEEVREALRQKGRERRHHQAFRQRHSEFLKQYARVRRRLGRKP